MTAEPSDDAEFLALAVHPRTQRACLRRGSHAFSYPIEFEGIREEDDPLEVDSEVRRVWFELHGWHWVIGEVDSEAGDAIQSTVDDLRDGADFRDAFADQLEDLGGHRCNNCDHVFEAEGSGGDLGPTCPECGHPADDPKIDG